MNIGSGANMNSHVNMDKNSSGKYEDHRNEIKVKGQWNYLYRAVDSTGKTIDFILSEKRDMKASKHFFQKALSSVHVQTPRLITVDKNPSYPATIESLKKK
jgi:IS6 family transposase